jgi:hypothetical protein
VIATGFDRAVTGEQAPAVRAAGPGVLNFPAPRQRPSVPVQQPPAPRTPPRMPQQPAPGSSGEVPEMEIPTFIRRQMD